MSLSDKDRLEEMKREVNLRTYDWYFFSDENHSRVNNTASGIMNKITDMTLVGPSPFKGFLNGRNEIQNEFMGIPLRHLESPSRPQPTIAAHFVATNANDCVVMSLALTALRELGPELNPLPYPLMAVCIHRAPNEKGDLNVVAIDVVQFNHIEAYYEYPANARLTLAMQGNEVPEWAAIMVSGINIPLSKKPHRTFKYVEELYYNNDSGQFSRDDFLIAIGNCFLGTNL